MHKFLNIHTILLGVLLLASGVGLAIILNTLSPEAGKLGVILFYADIFALVLSVSTLGSFYLRRLFGQRELVNLHLRVSIREGCLLGILGVLVLILQSFRLLTLLTGGFLSVAVIFLESFFLVHDKQP